MTAKYPFKLIEWHDAYNGNHAWFDADTMPEEMSPAVVQTVGFEVQRTETQVTLSMSLATMPCGKQDLCDLFTIPLAVVVREKTFRIRK